MNLESLPKYPITVPYQGGKTIKKLLSLGRYDWFNPQITDRPQEHPLSAVTRAADRASPGCGRASGEAHTLSNTPSRHPPPHRQARAPRRREPPNERLTEEVSGIAAKLRVAAGYATEVMIDRAPTR